MTDDSALDHALFFATLPHRVRADLATICQSQRHAAGSCIFREGEHVDQIFFIRSGDVALEMDVPGRGRQRLLSLGVGDLLGWSPLFSQAGMTATAIALSDAELLSLPVEEVRQRCEADHELGYLFMRQVALSLCQRLVGTRLQLLDLFRDNAAAAALPTAGQP